MSNGWEIEMVRPSTQFGGEVDGMLNAMRAFQVCNVAYIACPITGGHRHLEWVRNLRHNAGSTHRAAVIEPNTASADDFCSRVRVATGMVCINPATLYRSHWSQDDYRNFWSRVIEAFATQMYLSKGWELSVGCLFECLLAIRHELPLYDHNFKEVSYEIAAKQALAGISVLTEIGEGSEFLKVLLNQFTQMGTQECSNESAKR